jgi:YD repeat-containing protein
VRVSVNVGYDAAAQPVSIGTSTSTYVSALTYTELGQPQEYAFGTTAEPAYLYDDYTYQGQLNEVKAEVGSSSTVVDDQHYGYDNSGDITSDADTPSGAVQVQCSHYDYLGRLQTAWSQGGSSCAASPTTTLESGAAAPYWDAYTYNTEGDLTKQVSTPATGTATTYANAFPATTGADGPHAVASQTDTGGSTTKTTFGYDDAGYTTSIAAGTTTDTLNWNAAGYPPGQLASVTSGSTTVAGYVYDASGSLLMQTDGSITTLYLPDEQVTSTTSGTTTTTKTGARYYALGGQEVAARTSAGTVYYLAGNQQGTSTVAINASNLAVTRRYYDPYGKAIGTTPATWPGTRGFVSGTADPPPA